MTAGGEIVGSVPIAPSVGGYPSAMVTARHVVIIGLMGAGKTSVGRRLAERLGRTWRDSDADIEAATGATVRELRDREGVDAMHARESAQLLDALATTEPSVISARRQRHRRSSLSTGDGRAGPGRHLAPCPPRGPRRAVRLGRRPSPGVRRLDRRLPRRSGRPARAVAGRGARDDHRRRRPDQGRGRRAGLRRAGQASGDDRPDRAHPRCRHRDRRQPRDPLRGSLARRRARRGDLRLGQHRRAAGRHQQPRHPRAGRPDRRRGRARTRDAARPAAPDGRRHPRSAGARACRAATADAAVVGAARGRPDPRRGAEPARGDHARHARAVDEPRARGPARSVAPPSPAWLCADGRRLRRRGQHDAADRVEHPLRPRRREDRVPRLGRRPRGGSVDPAAAGPRSRRHRAGAHPPR